MNIKDWDGRVDLNESIDETARGVFTELMETAVSRSPFQLARFVVHSHGRLEEGAGPIMRQQALREIETCLEGIARIRIEIERAKRDIARLDERKPPDFDLDIMEKQIILRRGTVSLVKKLREYYTLKAILDELPRYTWQEFNELEPKRWANRLLRQCGEYHESLVQGLDRGDLTALKQGMSDDVLPDIGKITDELMRERFDRLAEEPKFQITHEKTFDEKAE